ncbi:MAG: immunoglobulin-like domain-containing protein [Bacteroidales bacterium]
MKKILLSVAALSMIIGATVITSCKKTDNTPPTITLVGGTVTVTIGTTYTDPGYSAVDNAGNSVTPVVTWSPAENLNVAGTYTITYTATDENGNSSTATRTVYVAITPAYLAPGTGGHWDVADVTDTTVNYHDILTVSSTAPLTTVWTAAFGAYTGAAIYFTLSGVDGRTITVPQQQTACGSDGDTRSFTGSGTVAADGATITINYTVTDITASTSPTTGTDTYTNKTKK